MPERSGYQATHRITTIYVWILVGIAALLGVMHLFFARVKIGGVYWFNLDKERNLPTWFTGILFFALGCSAIAAYYRERRHNSEEDVPPFHLPLMWLGVGLAGLLMSLDEITILHENLFWKEVRLASEKLGDPWIYVTQWQILFSPVIVLVLGYLVIFFSNRFSAGSGLRRIAFTGVGCWIGALLLEGLRGGFKLKSKLWYSIEVLIEEELEIIGVILLLSAITYYIIDITLDFNPQRRDGLKRASRFLTRRAVASLVITILALSAGGGGVNLIAQKQASADAPLPSLYKRAKREAVQTEKYAKGVGGLPSAFPEIAADRVWFDDIKSTISVAQSDAASLMEYVMDSLEGDRNRAGALPEAMRKDDSPRIVFLSISDGSGPARVAMGSGKGLDGALEEALSRARESSDAGLDPQWVKLDIVNEVSSTPYTNILKPMKLERGLEGIAFPRRYGLAFLPDEITANGLLDKRRRLWPTRMQNYMSRRFHPAPSFGQLGQLRDIELYHFTTSTFFSDGAEILTVYRGHRFHQGFSQDELLSASIMGGRYLVRSVLQEGRFVYKYQPHTDTESRRYNILRHAGTIYSMMELYDLTGDQELLQAAEKAIEYMLEWVKPCGSKKRMACVVQNGYIKLGGNALAVIALAQYTKATGHERYMPVMLKLGKWIESALGEDGEFVAQKQEYPDGKILPFKSQYYPGEALLALVRIYGLDPDRSWLDAAEEGAQYLINVRDGGLSDSELIHDHWLLYALNELYHYRRNQLYMDHSFKIVGAIIRLQNRNPAYKDWLGSYYRPPRSTPTATRSEGLVAAYRLARDFDKPGMAEKILESIILGVGFQLQTQFRPESAIYLKDPQRALGGFHRSLTNNEIRIDYVQHNISSLIGLYQIMQAGR